MPTDRINGVQLYWKLSGEQGEPVVLVHGSWGDHRNWDQVVPSLARSFRVLTYDRRGHSRSQPAPRRGSIDDDVEDLAALMRHAFGGPAHVVASSFGAAIALRLACEEPGLIRSLVAHEPPLLGLLDEDPTVQPALAAVRERMAAAAALLRAGDIEGGTRRFVDGVAFGPGAWERLPPATREIFLANAATWLDELREPQVLDMELHLLSGLNAPALLTWGGASAPYFALLVKRVAAAIPYARQHVFPAAGHVPHLSHPAEYVAVVGDFITTATAATAA